MDYSLCKNKKTVFIFILILIVVVGVIFLFRGRVVDYIPAFPITADVQMSVSDVYLKKGEKKLIVLESLNPKILIMHKRPLTAIKLDDSLNLLEELSLIKAIRLNNSTISLEIPHVLQPKLHTIEIVDNNGEILLFHFILALRDEFISPLPKSPFWIIPESTRQNHRESWYTQDGVLKIDKLPKGPHASLVFQYTFRDDVTIDFILTPSSEVINLVVYFLQSSKSLVIGNGDNRRTVII